MKTDIQIGEKALNNKLKWRVYLDTLQNSFIPFLGIILMIVIFEVSSSGKLLRLANLNTILNQSFSTMIIAIGATFVFAHGGMDISYGGVLGVSILGAAVVSNTQYGYLSFVVAILISVGWALINGGVSILSGVSPFITSLCILFMCKGILTTFCTSEKIAIPVSMSVYDNWMLKAAVLAAVILTGYILFNKTRLGKSNKAIGGNIIAAEQAGVNTRKYRFLAYLVSGITTGIASFFTMVRMGSVSSGTGAGLEMSVITALVLGGLPLSGGAKSKIFCAILGSISITILKNGLIIIGVNDRIIEGIQGIIILIIIYLSYKKEKDALLV